jgi:ABC-type dipeptide/oligopeptide/nickel transport system permease component
MSVTLVGAAVVVFFVIRVVPGNPIAMMLPPGASEEDIARLTAHYGLDKTIFEQFWIWLTGVFHGDFGTSISLRQPVMPLVLGRLPATLELAIFALVIAVVIGGIMALTGVRHRETRTETAIDVANGVGLSIPDFLWALILIVLFGVLMPVFHISGRISPSLDLPFVTQFYVFESIVRLRFDLWWDLLKHMFMPALGAGDSAGGDHQPVAQTIAEGNHASRLRYAVAHKGLQREPCDRLEALPNAVLPTLTLIGVQFTFLIGGTVIIERLFSYEGLGNMAIDAVINRDLPLIQGIVIVFALLFTMINLIVDMTYALLNPRLRHA